MGHKVYITSDINSDEQLLQMVVDNVDPLIILLWPWFLTAMDDWGRSTATAAVLKTRIGPGFPWVTHELLETAVLVYSQNGLLTLYEIGGRQYIAIDPEKWFRYQTHIHREKRNRDESRCPPPPSNEYAHSRAEPRTLAQGSDVSRNPADEREDARDSALDCASPSSLPPFLPSTFPPFHPSPSEEENNHQKNAPAHEPERSTQSTPSQSTPPQLARPEGWQELLQFVQANRPTWYLTPMVVQNMLEAVDKHGAAVVRFAIEQAIANGATGWRYVERILMGWEEAGVITLDEARAQVERYAQRRSGNRTRASPQRPAEGTLGALEQAIADAEEAERRGSGAGI